jgi:hypothetical protein
VDYAVGGAEGARAVAVDGSGRIWFGDRIGMHRYEAGQWRLIPYEFGESQGVCDLTPAADGAMFAQIPNGLDCQNPLQTVLRVPPDGSSGIPAFVGSLVEQTPHLVRSASRRNRLWTVAPDCAIWFTSAEVTQESSLRNHLHRRDARGLATYLLPFRREAVRSLEVDANNHVWVVADGSLWRLSAKADFRLQPHALLLAPGVTRRQHLPVSSVGGYDADVNLTSHSLPADLSGQIEPAIVRPGETFTLRFSAGVEMPLGTYAGTLLGVSGEISHTVGITIAVASTVYDQLLPVVAD